MLSMHDLFTASISLVGDTKLMILPLTILISAAIAVFPSDPKSPLSPFGPCRQGSPFGPSKPCKPGGPRILITLFCLVSPTAKLPV